MNNSYQIVERQGGAHVFPNSIPRKRSNRDTISKLIIGLGAIAGGCIFCQENIIEFLYASLHYNYAFLIIIELSKRLSFLFEEFNHLESRYEGQLKHLLLKMFSFNKFNSITIVEIGTILVVNNPGNPILCIAKYGTLAWILSLFGTIIISTIYKLEENLLYTTKIMDDLKGLDYGSGMAYSFFYGYLNLLLPCFGDERIGLQEQIEDYEAKNGVTFASKKLYIFIPLSAHCPIRIDKVSQKMDTGGSLSSVKKDRAGVKDRHYHNSVYKVYLDPNLKPIYVCAEYATPLLTLYEVIHSDHEDARQYKNHQKEIVTNFYMTLDKILKNDRNCRDLCELIYYKDIDNDGEPLELDVGDLLLERVLNNKKNK